MDAFLAFFGLSLAAPETAAEAAKLPGAILTFLLTTSAAILGFVGKAVWTAAARAQERRQKRARSIVDIAVYAQFLHDDIKAKFSAADLPRLERLIDTEPEGLRFYVLATGDSYALRGIRAVRHTFAPREVALIDNYVDLAAHFRGYYEALASDQFAALSRPRKKAVVASLIGIGAEVIASHARMKAGVAEIGDALRSLPTRD